MATKTTTSLETPLRDQLDRLAEVEPQSNAPVLSVYLGTPAERPDAPASTAAFLKRAFADQAATLTGASRENFDRAVERIDSYLADNPPRSGNGLAIFCCAGEPALFEAIPLDVAIEQPSVFVADTPYLYPLAKLNDQHPRYAAVLLDTNSARLFVFGLGSVERVQKVKNRKTRRNTMGGWSQARYQRRADNFHKHHIKEVVDVLDRLVTEEHLIHIVVACDDVARPILMEQLPKHLSEIVIEVGRLDVKNAPDHDVLAETMEALREEDAKTDAEHVERMIGAWRAGGLAVVGAAPTLQALEMRQVEELLITTTPAQLQQPRGESADNRDQLADTLVTKAQQNSARIRFIEDPALLADIGGVGALLRFRI